ncbi:MAG: hypothetical protein V3T74_11135 [Gemmatimonadales bacterium]
MTRSPCPRADVSVATAYTDVNTIAGQIDAETQALQKHFRAMD